MIQTLFSLRQNPELPTELNRLLKLPRRRPFEDEAIELVSTVSKKILSSDLARQYPELAALAHWFRPSNLQDMSRRIEAADSKIYTRPRGLVFALAPANVDVLFIYGWFLSLLCGNASIIRVSQKTSKLRETFISLIYDLAKDESYKQVLSDSWIITYQHDNQLTAEFSSVADVRLIWGGDASIAEIRKIPLNPLAVEVAFADRFSLAVFNAATILDQSEKIVAETARRFANDTLWFAQQACSSPRAVFWVGTNEQIEQASKKFWPLYRQAAQNFEDAPASIMARVSDLFSLAAKGMIESVESPIAQLPCVGLGTSVPGVRDIHSGYGLFVEYRIQKLTNLIDFLENKDQTLVACGFSLTELESLIDLLPNRSIDRIVKPGQAMDFDSIWDGIDLLQVLLRKIKVSTPASLSDI